LYEGVALEEWMVPFKMCGELEEAAVDEAREAELEVLDAA
jgi:hypothetical protein